MRIISSLWIALALTFGVSLATAPIATADHHEEAKGKVKGESQKVASKTKAEGKEAKGDAKAAGDKAKSDGQAKADKAKAAQKVRAEEAKAQRKTRMAEAEDKRNANRMNVLDQKRERLLAQQKKQLDSLDKQVAQEKARHEKRIEQINQM